MRRIINPAYEAEVADLVKGRHRWKATSDAFEATSKVVAGLSSVMAFAASSIQDKRVVHWISFGAGCLGTLGITMLLFANYSAKESRERTAELNILLRVAGITPMPQIAHVEGEGSTEAVMHGGPTRSVRERVREAESAMDAV